MKVGAGTVSLETAEVLIADRYQGMERARNTPKLHSSYIKAHKSSSRGEGELKTGGITVWGCQMLLETHTRLRSPAVDV